MKFSIHLLSFAALAGADGILAGHAAAAAPATKPRLFSSPSRQRHHREDVLRSPAFLHKRRTNPIGGGRGKRNRERLEDTGGGGGLVVPRGGACNDSNPALATKIGTTTVAESAALLGILWSSVRSSSGLPPGFPRVFGQPLVELLASFFVVFGSSFVGAVVDGSLSAATNQALNPNKVQGDPNWYANLVKPWWNPPGWVFPIMWLVVSKPTQLCALSRMLKFGVGADRDGSLVALAAYTTHLALGNAWNKVFFGLECIGRGTFVISLFYAALLATAYLFYQINPGAGYYMLPTCGWVTVATALQWSIYFNNQKK